MVFSDQLKYLRRKNRYSQEKLAELCGVSRQAVTKWENGTATPEVGMLIRLSVIFHVSLDMLLTGAEPIPQADSQGSDALKTENEKLINAGLRQAMNCDDPQEEIQTFIGYIGRMMNCDRTYIFEVDPCGTYCNTYEWCNRGVIPQIAQLQGIPKSDIAPWLENFRNGSRVYISDLEALKETEPTVYEWLAPQQISTLIAIPLLGGSAFLGVDNPAMAFVSQTAVLLELVVHYVESMLQRRDLVENLRIESDRNRFMDDTERIVSFYINHHTGSIAMDMEPLRPLGYHFELHCMDDLYALLDLHPECRNRVLDDGINKAIETREAVAIEFVFYTSSHLIRWASLSIRPFLDSQRNLLHLRGTLQDVSDAHEVIERYNAFTSRLKGGMHICYLSDPCHLEYASDNLCNLLGYSREEFTRVVGTSYDSLVIDEDYAAFKGFVKRLADNPGSIETCEYGLKHKDGSVIRVIDTMESKLDSNGIVYGYANVMDISGARVMIDDERADELHQFAEMDKQFEIVDALSRDYRNVFFVDLEKDQAIIHKLNGYVTQGMDRKSTDPIPYYEYCERYIHSRVYPADWDMMAKAMHPDTVRGKLKDRDEYSMTYRILIGDEIHHCQFKYILLSRGQSHSARPLRVIAAFKIIDDEVHEELKRRQITARHIGIINAFLKIYLVGYFVDLTSGIITEFSGSENATEISASDASSVPSDTHLPEGVREKLRLQFSSEIIQTKLSGLDIAYEQWQSNDGSWYEFNFIAGDRDAAGRLQQYFILLRDINKEKALELKQKEEMELALRDPLTGVMSRLAYQEALDGMESGAHLGIIYCDLNGLKNINDMLGHKSGDQFLCRFADLLKAHFSPECIFRIGGDEFICMISEISEVSFAARVRSLTDDIRNNDMIAAIGAAHGLGSEKDSLLQLAEMKMYQDKKFMKGQK